MPNYKILNFPDTVPIKILEDYYQTNNAEALSYESVMKIYRDNGLLIPAYWSTCMRQIGNETVDVIPHHLTLQEHWCKEKGVSFDKNKNSLLTDILDEQISKIKPDVIFFYAGAILGLEISYIRELKKRHSFIKIVALMWGDYHPFSWYKKLIDAIDISFTCNVDYKDKMISAGIEAYENHNSFDKNLYDKLNKKELELEHDFIFAGATGFLCGQHLQRYEILKELLEKIEIKCWASEQIPILNNQEIYTKIKSEIKEYLNHILVKVMINIELESLKKLKKLFSANNFSANNDTNMICRQLDRVIDEKYNLEEEYVIDTFPKNYQPLSKLYPSKVNNGFVPNYYRLLASSKVIFNTHRNEPEDYSNIRIFEATGVGSCLMTDKPEKVKSYFLPDEEILTFSSVEECVEKVNYVLENEKVRKEIASKGQLRTINNYTTMHHCEKIHDTLKNRI